MSRLLTMNRLGIGGVVMMIVVMLAALGLGIALWSKILTIDGIIRTGSVNAEFVRVFTDDDDFVDNATKDSQDTGNCEIVVGPEVPPPGFPDKRTAPGTSCDPAETGRDPKDHYDKDVARCDAMFLADGQDLEEQEGSQRARLAITNGYPSYHCTAWFDIHNNGTIPVHLHSVLVMGAPVIRCEQGGSTPFDLSGDGAPDIEICVSDLPAGEPQIHPSEEFQFNLDIHIMQTAPQGATLEFTSTICLHQWNEEIGVCPLAGVGCAGAIEDICVDADGIASAGDGIPGAIETSLGDALTAWPTGIGDQGIDGFDNDASGTWTVGDDIHLEATGPVCTTGIRNALHDLGDDCKVLDYNGSLFNGQLVDCDFEGGIDFNPGPAGCDPLLKFHDANSDGFYDDAEDIILDTNNNGVFD